MQEAKEYFDDLLKRMAEDIALTSGAGPREALTLIVSNQGRSGGPHNGLQHDPVQAAIQPDASVLLPAKDVSSEIPEPLVTEPATEDDPVPDKVPTTGNARSGSTSSDAVHLPQDQNPAAATNSLSADVMAVQPAASDLLSRQVDHNIDSCHAIPRPWEYFVMG